MFFLFSRENVFFFSVSFWPTGRVEKYSFYEISHLPVIGVGGRAFGLRWAGHSASPQVLSLSGNVAQLCRPKAGQPKAGRPRRPKAGGVVGRPAEGRPVAGEPEAG